MNPDCNTSRTRSQHEPESWYSALSRDSAFPLSNGVAGWFGGVLPSRWGGPPEGGVGELVDMPPGVLLEPVVAAALRTAITQTRPAAGLVGGVVLEVAGGGGTPADGAGTGSVPDLGQVPELDPGVMGRGREPVITVLGGDRVEGDGQIRAVCLGSGAQCPGAVSAGRAVLAGGGEGEPRAVPVPGPARWSWSL